MAKFWSLTALVVGGLIVIGLVKNSSGTSQVLGGVTSLEGNVGNQLTGTTAPTTTAAKTSRG